MAGSILMNQDYVLPRDSNRTLSKGGFKSEDTGEFLFLQNKYSKSLSWAENLKVVYCIRQEI